MTRRRWAQTAFLPAAPVRGLFHGAPLGRRKGDRTCFDRLLHRALRYCLEAGRKVLAPLEADQRLTEAAAILRAAQDRFEACVVTVEDRTHGARRSEAAAADALRLLADALRGFGLFLLGLSRNHPQLEPCPGYYPEGYGEALRLGGEDLADFADITIIKLNRETDPRIRAHLEPLTAARDAYIAAAATARADAKARDEAIALAQKERRAWARALVASRHRAEELCFGDRAYIRSIFAPAMAPRRGRHRGARDPRGRHPHPGPVVRRGQRRLILVPCTNRRRRGRLSPPAPPLRRSDARSRSSERHLPVPAARTSTSRNRARARDTLRLGRGLAQSEQDRDLRVRLPVVIVQQQELRVAPPDPLEDPPDAGPLVRCSSRRSGFRSGRGGLVQEWVLGVMHLPGRAPS